MPLYKKLTHDADTQIFVWKITEEEDVLRLDVDLQEKHLNRLNGMLSEQHRKGFLSVRKLLQAAGYHDFDLRYDTNGKPSLTDGKYISITHSFEFSAIIISTKNIGIDIEKQREKITRIADKFIGSEVDFLQKDIDYIEQLSVVWGAKESLYKMCNSRSLSFKQDMHVQNFSLNNGTGNALVDCKELDFGCKFTFYFDSFDGYTLVYALESE
ncbi:MAG: 4'-phosphopantetheinyl transferase superfamily protein [Myroides sp.]|nr:4'-phosphopantetheinyl transferase family protein [uncultured Flavobacterium sp.]MDO5635776.1 4'-phosphopantetheinyl transferase superfamily protein [Myroides sp.]